MMKVRVQASEAHVLNVQALPILASRSMCLERSQKDVSLIFGWMTEPKIHAAAAKPRWVLIRIAHSVV